MYRINKNTPHGVVVLCRLVMAVLPAFLLSSCHEWNDCYDSEPTPITGMETYDGDVKNYMRSVSDVSTMSQIFDKNGVYDSLDASHEYTLVVIDNNHFSDKGSADCRQWARYCVCDMAVTPKSLVDGYGIATRLGKTMWVATDSTVAVPATTLDGAHITKTVKANNGYIYYLDKQPVVRQSIYEYLNSLDGDYSVFRNLVERYDSTVFDQQASSIVGTDIDGRVLYDSVFAKENSLMDRYTAEGRVMWNMRDEQYLTTMFLPTNEQIEGAISNAMDNVELWLGRTATANDRRKFEEWIVKACFVNRRLGQYEVNARADDFYSVGGYVKDVNSQTDETTYKEEEAAYWKPTVQNCRAAEGVELSNGVAYRLRYFKIPNHVIIYRVKSKFYQLWDNMTRAEKNAYFNWRNLTDPQDGFEMQSAFTLSESLPTMEYYLLTAVPTDDALRDSSVTCSFTFEGIAYDEEEQTVRRCYLPAGEYYLRMGFWNRLGYTVNIYFNGELVRKDMALGAQGSNFHFDRGAASDIPHYGEAGIAYPEGFDLNYWQKRDAKAIAYDTDGYTVAKVVLPEAGYFSIRVESPDLVGNYKRNYPEGSTDRSKANICQFGIYHWCLRPTVNNY